MLIDSDGFDLYTVGNSGRSWAGNNSVFDTAGGGGTSAPATRFSYGRGLATAQSFGGATRNLPGNYVTGFTGFAYRSYSSNYTIVELLDGGTDQVDLRVSATGQLSVTRNGTVLGTSGGFLIPINSWMYLEFGATINATTGSVTVRVNGTNVINVSGVNTKTTANAYFNQVYFPANSYLDDWYFCDNTGARNNTFLGDVRMYAQMPNGAGGSTQWTPNGQTNNYQCVSQNPPNAADYVSSSTPGQIDLYTIPSISAADSIKAVNLRYFAEKDDSGTRTVESVLKSGSTQVTGAQNALGTSYLDYHDVFETDPATSTDWTLSGVNAIQIGVEEVS